MSNPETILTLADPFDDARLRDLVDAIQGANGDIAFRDAIHDLFDPWVKGARQMAVELTKPVEGTHVFDMIAAVEQGNIETTETLIHMVAATVLSKLIEDEGGGRSNISFSPADMDAMHRDYEMAANRDGMVTTIKIIPRDTHALIVGGPDHALNRLMAQDEDTEGALPQVEASPAKPYFFFRDGAGRQGPMSQDDAQALVLKSVDPTAHVENRMCGRAECPNSDMQGACPACNGI